MSNQIVHAPGIGPHSQSPVKAHGGRTYTPVPGSPQLVPTQDAFLLVSNHWSYSTGRTSNATLAGPSSQRPSNPPMWSAYNDTTVGALIIWDGIAWRHHQTGGTP